MKKKIIFLVLGVALIVFFCFMIFFIGTLMPMIMTSLFEGMSMFHARGIMSRMFPYALFASGIFLLALWIRNKFKEKP